MKLMISTATKIMTAETQMAATDRDARETLFSSSLDPAQSTSALPSLSLSVRSSSLLPTPQLMLMSIDVVIELENA